MYVIHNGKGSVGRPQCFHSDKAVNLLRFWLKDQCSVHCRWFAGACIKFLLYVFQCTVSHFSYAPLIKCRITRKRNMLFLF